MTARDEVEAAYFALLRAREELEVLRRYEEILRDDRARLTGFSRAGAELVERISPRLRRPLRHTEEPLADAVAARLAAIDDELGRLPDRVTAAEDYVADAEREHAHLRATA